MKVLTTKAFSGLVAGALLIGLLPAVAMATATSGTSFPPPPPTSTLTNIHAAQFFSGIHQHYFYNASPPLSTFDVDSLYVWVYLDPANPPTEVMLQVASSLGWTRAHWGPENTTWPSTSMGSRPTPGVWTKLVVSMPLFGYPGAINGLAYTLFGGVAYWGEAGLIRNGVTIPWVGNTTPPGAILDSGNEVWKWIPYYRRNWLQFGGDSAHSGNNPTEALIGLDNVANLAPLSTFTPLSVTPEVGPVVLTNVNVSGTVRDVLYVNGAGMTTAFDAYSGAFLWNKNTNVEPSVSVRPSVPAIDPLFNVTGHNAVYGMSIDGCLHKRTLDTGIDFYGTGLGVAGGAPPATCITNGWPARITAKAADDRVKTAVTVGIRAGVPYAYLATTAQSDGGEFQGSITAINLNDGTQRVFNAMCSDKLVHLERAPSSNSCPFTGGSFWQRGGLTYDILTERLLGATGNFITAGGGFSVTNRNWPITLLALKYDGSGSALNAALPVDSFTPSGFAGMQSQTQDLDLGSTNTLILPNAVSSLPHLAAQGGKDGVIRIINLDNMNGTGVAGTPSDPVKTLNLVGSCAGLAGDCAVTGPMATWINSVDNTTWIFANSRVGLNAIQLSANTVNSSGQGWNAAPLNPVNTWGAFVANGVLYFANNALAPPPAPQCPAGSTGRLWAVNAATGTILWSVCHSLPGDGQNHQTPLVVNGVLYFGNKAYSIGGVSPRSSLPSINLASGGATDQLTAPFGGSAAQGNDDNLDPKWANNSVFHTNNGASTVAGNVGGPWWKVFTPNAHNVRQIVLYNRTDGLESRLTGFKIFYQSTSGWLLAADYSNYLARSFNPVITIPVSMTNPQAIIIQKTHSGLDSDYLHLAEVRVIGD